MCKRQHFYRPEILGERVRTRVEEVRAAGETIDYLCFVPDGEPTLDLNLGSILGGVLTFSESFRGRLITETMLVEGLNDKVQLLEDLARFLVKALLARSGADWSVVQNLVDEGR